MDDGSKGTQHGSPGTALPPLVATAIEPYVEQAAEARSKSKIRRVEQDRLSSSAGAHGQRGSHGSRPSVPASTPSSKSPRPAPKYRNPMEESEDSFTNYNVIGFAGDQREYGTPSPPRHQSNSTGKPRRPATSAAVGGPTSTERRAFAPERSGHSSPGHGGSQFDGALDALAAMKMHEYIVNRKNKKTPKFKLWQEIRGYKQQTVAEIETEIFDRFKQIIAAWKIRCYVEAYRLRVSQGKASRKLTRVTGEVVKLRDMNGKLARALADASAESSEAAARYQQHVDELEALRAAKPPVQEAEVRAEEKAVDPAQEAEDTEEAVRAEMRRECVVEVEVLRAELELTRGSFNSLLRSSADQEQRLKDQLAEAEATIAELRQEVNDVLAAGEARVQTLVVQQKETILRETAIPAVGLRCLPDFAKLAATADILKLHQTEASGCANVDTSAVTASVTATVDDLTVGERLAVLSIEYDRQQKALYETALVGDSTAAYNSGLQRLVSEFAGKLKAAEGEIEVYMETTGVQNDTISTLNARVSQLLAEKAEVSAERDMMGDTVSLAHSAVEGSRERLERHLMDREDRLSLATDAHMATFLRAMADGSRIVIVKRDGAASSKASRASLGTSGGKAVEAAANHPNLLHSFTGHAHEQSGTSLVVRTELEDKLLMLVSQLDAKLGAFDTLSNPQRVASEKRAKYFEEQIREHDDAAHNEEEELEVRVAEQKSYWRKRGETLQEMRDNCERNLQTAKRKIVEIKSELRFIHRQKNHLKSVLRSWHEDYVLTNQKEPSEEELKVHTEYLMVAFTKAQGDLQEKLRHAMVVTMEATNIKREYDDLTAKIIKANRRAENGESPTCSRPASPSADPTQFTVTVAQDNDPRGTRDKSSTGKDELYLNSAFEDMRMSPIGALGEASDSLLDPKHLFDQSADSNLGSWNVGKKFVVKDRKKLEQQSLMENLKTRSVSLKQELGESVADLREASETLHDLILVQGSLKENICLWLLKFHRKNKGRMPTLREKRADKEACRMYIDHNNVQVKIKEQFAVVSTVFERVAKARTELVDTQMEMACCQRKLDGMVLTKGASEAAEKETEMIEAEIMSEDLNDAVNCVLPPEPIYEDAYAFNLDVASTYTQQSVAEIEDALRSLDSASGSPKKVKKGKGGKKKKNNSGSKLMEGSGNLTPAKQGSSVFPEASLESPNQPSEAVSPGFLGLDVSESIAIDAKNAVADAADCGINQLQGGSMALAAESPDLVMGLALGGSDMGAKLQADVENSSKWSKAEWGTFVHHTSRALVEDCMEEVLGRFNVEMLWRGLEEVGAVPAPAAAPAFVKQANSRASMIQQARNESPTSELGSVRIGEDGFASYVQPGEGGERDSRDNSRNASQGAPSPGYEIRNTNNNEMQSVNIAVTQHANSIGMQSAFNDEYQGAINVETHSAESAVNAEEQNPIEFGLPADVARPTASPDLVHVFAAVVAQASPISGPEGKGDQIASPNAEQSRVSDGDPVGQVDRVASGGPSPVRAHEPEDSSTSRCTINARDSVVQERSVASIGMEKINISTGGAATINPIAQRLMAEQEVLETIAEEKGGRLVAERNSLEMMKVSFYELDAKKEELKGRINVFVEAFERANKREPSLPEKRNGVGDAYDDLWRVQDRLKKLAASIDKSEQIVGSLEVEHKVALDAVHEIQAKFRLMQDNEEGQISSISGFCGGENQRSEQVNTNVLQKSAFKPQLQHADSFMPPLSREVSSVTSTDTRAASFRTPGQVSGEDSPQKAIVPFGRIMDVLREEEEQFAAEERSETPGSVEALTLARKQLTDEIEAHLTEINMLEGYVKVAKMEVREAKKRRLPIKATVRDWMDSFEMEFGRPPRNADKATNAVTEEMFAQFDKAQARLNQALEHQQQTETVLKSAQALLSKKKLRLITLGSAPSMSSTAASVNKDHQRAQLREAASFRAKSRKI